MNDRATGGARPIGRARALLTSSAMMMTASALVVTSLVWVVAASQGRAAEPSEVDARIAFAVERGGSDPRLAVHALVGALAVEGEAPHAVARRISREVCPPRRAMKRVCDDPLLVTRLAAFGPGAKKSTRRPKPRPKPRRTPSTDRLFPARTGGR